MYFDAFPTTKYTLAGKTETVVDIFRKVIISTENTDNVFVEELVQDSDSLESLAEKYYGDSKLSWIILLANNIVDPINEFVRSSEQLDSLINKKYAGSVFYFEENVNLQEGDVLISTISGVTANLAPSGITQGTLNTSNYCFVNDYSNEFRYARVTNINGSFSTSSKVIAYRKLNDVMTLITFTKELSSGAGDQDACVLPIKKIDSYISAPKYFFNVDKNQIVSAYQRYNDDTSFVDLDATGTFTSASDKNAFRSSLLYQKLMNGAVISDISIFTLGEEIRINNEKYRKIKILNKNFIKPFIKTFNNLISDSTVRFRIISPEG